MRTIWTPSGSLLVLFGRVITVTVCFFASEEMLGDVLAHLSTSLLD
jgi:hypothetical protein